MVDKLKLIVKNSIKCLECGEILVSKYQHDFSSCSCPNQAFTDGGKAYQRVGAKDLDKVEYLTEYEYLTQEELDEIKHQSLQNRINKGEMIEIGGKWMSKELWKAITESCERLKDK